MRILVWALRLVVFLLLLVLAARNLQTVTFYWLGDYIWEAPLVVMLLSVFVLGVLLGIAGMSLNALRQRRALARLGQSLEQCESKPVATESDHPLMPPRA